MGRPKLGESELGRQTIIDAALKILDSHGIEALSLARVASLLGVQAPSLYHHFSSKAELYTYIGEALSREVLSSLDPALSGRELLWAYGRAKRANLRARRDASKLVFIAGVSDEVRNELIPAFLARVVGPEIGAAEARMTLTAIQALALGWAAFEANPATDPVMRYVNEGDAGFEGALRRLVFGETPEND